MPELYELIGSMKESSYNSYVEVDDGITLFYNSITNKYLLLNGRRSELFNSCRESVELISAQDASFFDTLVNNGFLVDNNLNEAEFISFQQTKRKFSTTIYEVLINPTMDCNLSCWYCYEERIEGSEMSKDLSIGLIKHIGLKFEQEPFKQLALGFFGGEPLLKMKKVVSPVLEGISAFCVDKNIDLNLGFTTNGTIITESFLKLIKPYKVSFQITFDGDKDNHNKVRKSRVNGNGTYDTIIRTLKKIHSLLSNYEITIRINYDENTLEGTKEIIEDISFLDKTKVAIHLIKIFQVGREKIDKKILHEVMDYCNKYKFNTSDLTLNRKDYVCYADNYNQAIINYNGLVFKCTATDFSDGHAEGVLLETGEIKWNEPKIIRRLSAKIPKKCLSCKLLPSCPGICSQALINNQCGCILEEHGMNIDDFIVNNFNNQVNAK